MTSAENITETGSQEIGRVAIIYADVKAISADGMERQLAVNSPVFAYDRIITEGHAKVSIVIHDDAHTQIDLGGRCDVIIDEDIFGGVSSEEIAGVAAEVQDLREAFFIQDIDLSAKPETLATDAADSARGVHTAADFERVTHEGEIFDTAGEKISVIFDRSDYTDLDNVNPVDPLDILIEIDDSTS